MDGDVFTYFGQITDGYEKFILKLIEELVNAPDKKEKLFVILTTGGGSAVAVERYVNIIRHHYNEVTLLYLIMRFLPELIFA